VLYVRNEDKPGIIGGLGKALGDAGINIATFHLGRARPGGEAIALILIDQPIPEHLLMAICALPHVTQCKALRF
jgi:D-3-phosphoglycerate dehydrogenase